MTISVNPRPWDLAEAYSLLFGMCAVDLDQAQLAELERKLDQDTEVSDPIREIATGILERAKDRAAHRAEHYGADDWRARVARDPAYAIRRIEALASAVELYELGLRPPDEFEQLRAGEPGTEPEAIADGHQAPRSAIADLNRLADETAKLINRVDELVTAMERRELPGV